MPPPSSAPAFARASGRGPYMRRSFLSSLSVLLGMAICASILLSSEIAAAQGEAGPSPGVVAGKVLDSSTGEPIIDAGVEVVGTKRQTRTDVDGRFSIKIPPGTYDLRFFATGYQGARVTGVKVESGK